MELIFGGRCLVGSGRRPELTKVQSPGFLEALTPRARSLSFSGVMGWSVVQEVAENALTVLCIAFSVEDVATPQEIDRAGGDEHFFGVFQGEYPEFQVIIQDIECNMLRPSFAPRQILCHVRDFEHDAHDFERCALVTFLHEQCPLDDFFRFDYSKQPQMMLAKFEGLCKELLDPCFV